jgi:hypothetical protein
MLTTKRQILATAAVMAGAIMTAGTAAAELAAQPAPAAHPARVAQWQPPAVPLSPTGAQHFEGGEST